MARRGSETHNLKLVLSLQDRASKGLSAFEARLRSANAAARKLQPKIDRQSRVGATGGQRITPQQELRLQREKLKLQQDAARLTGIEARNRAQSTASNYRAMRDEIKLRQDGLRLVAQQRKMPFDSQMQDMRILREKMRMRQQYLRLMNDEQEMLQNSMTFGGVGTGAAGVGTLALVRKGVNTAGDFEAAMADLRLSIQELGKDGQINFTQLSADMNRFEQLGMRLGNRLPGTTQDFIEMFSTLKQGGLSTKTILDGTGEAVANLSVITGNVPKEIARPFAQYAQQFQLTGDEARKLSDTLARLKFATGLDPAELIEGSKFFQLRAGAPLGLTGLQGAEQGGRMLATLRSFGLEGGIGGRELGSFVGHLGFTSKEQQKALAELRKEYGITLQFFDKKGKFLGFEHMFREMEKLRKLSSEDLIQIGGKLFTQEGLAPATIMMKSGVQGWQEINARIDRIPPQQELINQKVATYNAKLEAALGTMQNLAATSFTPMLDQLKPLLDMANDVASSGQEFAKAHPEIAKVVSDLVGLAGLALTLTGGLKAMTTAWRLWRIASAVGSSEAAVLGFLNNTRTASDAAGASLVATSGKAGVLKSKLGALAATSPLRLTIQFMVAGAVIEQILSWKKEYDDKQKQLKEQNAAAGKAYDDAVASGQIYVPRPDFKQKEFNRALAEKSIEAFKMGNTLEISLQPERRGLFENYFSWQRPYGYGRTEQIGDVLTGWGWGNETGMPMPTSPYSESWQFNPYRAGHVWRNSEAGKSLQDPQVLAQAIRFFQQGGGEMKLNDEGIQKALKALEVGFPEAYKQAFQIASDEVRGLGDTTGKLNTSFSELLRQSDNLPGSIQRSSLALDNFAFKLNTFTPTFTPTFSFNPPLGGFGGTTSPTTGSSTTGGFTGFKPPLSVKGSAIGSIVQGDGLINAHKGNVVFPAALSRRRPGDWLKDFDALRALNMNISSPPMAQAGVKRGGGAPVSIGSISVTVQASGSGGRIDERKLAALVGSEVASQIRRIIDSGEIHNSVEARIYYREQKDDERS